ncbi:class V chitinase CHIT5-like [Humulus lupulus]|uniref:class V chitinase CHIT5-like n=1 Tax=Humulus lupulus TaxID=3486 RepID=UPI002B407F52|nr:class V chitinase CHIT5-like [Humulus lupulus]
MATAKFQIGYWVASTEKPFPPQNDPIPFFTHLYYAFLQVQAETGELIIPVELEQDMNTFVQCVHDKQKKAIVSIGGTKPNNSKSDDPSIAISTMAKSAAKRSKFIESTFAFAKNYGFDGLELAWVYPKTKNDMRNLTNLFSEWKASNTEKKLLSAAVYCQPNIPNDSNQEIKYPAELDKHIDILNIILYNYCPVTCQHSQFNPSNPGPVNSSKLAIDLWSEARISKYKLVMGIPLYGGKWILADEKDTSIGAPVEGYLGRVAYRDIPDPEAGKFDDKVTKCMYKAENEGDRAVWYGYEATPSVMEKVEYAKKNLGGYFLYSIGYDDDDFTLCSAAAEQMG